jgi:hypothetical protein
MNYARFGAAAAVALALSVPYALSAQMPSWSAEQKAVWAYVEQSWVDDAAQNGKRPADYADPQMIAWGASHPSPRGREAMIRWGRFEATQGKTLQYEITPQAISISGNTAVVAYTVFMVREEGTEKKVERAREGVVETLVRSGSGWKYLATSGFTISK